ncbi:hypothetical protein WME97_40060 [Sorangium sp. So ce367]|uniref:hypothetical protein n=1 Tax=Sorangium sp. So ce367 TaxID=3133305 RepID=UPI003F5E74A9
MKISFDGLCEKLATTAGGFTVWLGAGASMAVTGGATPTWTTLVDQLWQVSGGRPSERFPDMPQELERLASKLGHRQFRRLLRQLLVESIQPGRLSPEVLAAQAVIAGRAGSIVSFNIEPHTASPLPAARGGGTLLLRTFLGKSPVTPYPKIDTAPGLISTPIYFPHGLLRMGNVVMTESEYMRHRGSIAVTTAVHLAIGGDLLILGMSMADRYLREALLANRDWLGEIYWTGTTFPFSEWARVTRVTTIEVEHARLWTGLADAFMTHDTSGRLKEARDLVLPSRLLDGRKIRLCDGHHRAGFALTAIAARHAPG